MIIRPITREEFDEAQNLSLLCFVMSRSEREKVSAPEPELFGRMRGAFDDTGRMTARLSIHPFDVRFGAHTVGMGGIGGVVSAPETRRQGNIRALFDAALREMRERGMLFSTLYPFSHTYYRQYGYELTCAARRVCIKMEHLPALKPSGTVSHWLPGEDDAVIRRIYDRFIESRNLAPLRDDRLWRRWLQKDPYEDRQYTYIWRDETGVPCGYVILRVQEKPEGHVLHIADLAVDGAGALAGLFAFLRNLSAAYYALTWDMPMWVDPYTFFPEPYHVEQSITKAGMARVLNVPGVLEKLPHPGEAGAYTLRITDPQLQENDGLWRVSFGGGRVRVTRVTDGDADWALDIPAFTQLALGYLDADGLLNSRPGVEQPKNLEVLRRVFVRRDVYMPEYF